jgi:hypothetical protein
MNLKTLKWVMSEIVFMFYFLLKNQVWLIHKCSLYSHKCGNNTMRVTERVLHHIFISAKNNWKELKS